MKTSNKCGWILERWEKALGRESSAHLQVPGLLLVSMASQTTDKAFGSSCKSSPELPRVGLYESPELPTLFPPARLSVITCTMWGSVCESSCQAWFFNAGKSTVQLMKQTKPRQVQSRGTKGPLESSTMILTLESGLRRDVKLIMGFPKIHLASVSSLVILRCYTDSGLLGLSEVYPTRSW